MRVRSGLGLASPIAAGVLGGTPHPVSFWPLSDPYRHAARCATAPRGMLGILCATLVNSRGDVLRFSSGIGQHNDRAVKVRIDPQPTLPNGFFDLIHQGPYSPKR